MCRSRWRLPSRSPAPPKPGNLQLPDVLQVTLDSQGSVLRSSSSADPLSNTLYLTLKNVGATALATGSTRSGNPRRVRAAPCSAALPSEPCWRVSSHTAQASREDRAGCSRGAVLLRSRALRARLQEA